MLNLVAFLASMFALMVSLVYSSSRNGNLVAAWAWIVTGSLLIFQSGISLGKGNIGTALFQFLIGVVFAIFINARSHFAKAKAEE